MFFELHRQFEELYNGISEKIDMVAERIKALSTVVRPEHRFSEYLKVSTIEEKVAGSVPEMIDCVIKDLETIVLIERRIIKEAHAFGDEATITMVGEFLVADEKSLWMFNAFKQK